MRRITPEQPLASRPRRRLLLGSVVVVLLAAGGVAVGTGSIKLPFHAAAQAPAAAAPPPPPVSVAAVERRNVTLWQEFSGRLEAVDRVELRPRVAGAIIDVPFHEGSLVHKGDVLVTIDPAPYAAEVQRAEAQLATAQAQLVLADKERVRAQRLAATAAGPARDVDLRVNDVAAAEAAVRSGEAAVVLARLNLGWTTVRAPIDGRVGRIEVTPGNLVPAGPTAPVLTTIVSIDPIYASFDADEATISRARASLPPGSGIGAIPVELGTLADTGTPITGKLQFIDNLVNTQTGTFRVRATFDNASGTLVPGQFARIRLGQPRQQPVIAVSERAIGTDQDRRFVFVIGKDDKAAYRAVQLGGMEHGLRIVTAGLEPGERVVVNGLQRIRPGATVAPTLVSMDSATELANR